MGYGDLPPILSPKSFPLSFLNSVCSCKSAEHVWGSPQTPPDSFKLQHWYSCYHLCFWSAWYFIFYCGHPHYSSCILSVKELAIYSSSSICAVVTIIVFGVFSYSSVYGFHCNLCPSSVLAPHTWDDHYRCSYTHMWWLYICNCNIAVSWCCVVLYGIQFGIPPWW